MAVNPFQPSARLTFVRYLRLGLGLALLGLSTVLTGAAPLSDGWFARVEARVPSERNAPVDPVLDAGSGLAGGSVRVTLEPALTTVAVAQAFDIAIVVEAGSQPVDAVDAFLAYDPERLAVRQITPGTALPVVLANHLDAGAGRITYSAGRQLDGTAATGTFALATVRFQALASTAPAGTPLAFPFQPPTGNTDAFHRSESVFDTAKHGVVVVEPVMAPCYDFSGNGRVDVIDIEILTARLGDPFQYLPRYDVAPDGRIDIADIAQVALDWAGRCP